MGHTPIRSIRARSSSVGYGSHPIFNRMSYAMSGQTVITAIGAVTIVTLIFNNVLKEFMSLQEKISYVVEGKTTMKWIGPNSKENGKNVQMHFFHFPFISSSFRVHFPRTRDFTSFFSSFIFLFKHRIRIKINRK